MPLSRLATSGDLAAGLRATQEIDRERDGGREMDREREREGEREMERKRGGKGRGMD